MARRRGRNRVRRSGRVRSVIRRAKRFTLPVAVVAGFAAPTIKVWEARGGGASGMAREAGRILTGVDFWNGQFNWQTMRYGLWPIIGGVLIHKFIGGKLGVNRALSAAGVPVIRL